MASIVRIAEIKMSKEYKDLTRDSERVEFLKNKLRELVEMDTCPECKAMVKAPWKESHEGWCGIGKILES